MNKLNLSLRSKILFGSLFLVLPLGLSLTMVYLFGSSGINAAQKEQRGLRATAPLWDAIFLWQDQTGDPSAAVQDYATYLEGEGKDLIPVTDATTGATWETPAGLTEALKTGGQGPEGVAAVHKKLISNILILADTSGLVLDPDLDSYYLNLALYQTVPNLLAKLTDLRSLRGSTETILAPEDRLLLYSGTQELGSQAQYLLDQMSRSLRALSPELQASAAPALQTLVDQIASLSSEIAKAAAGPARGEPFDAGALTNQETRLLDTLKEFRTQGVELFHVLLAQRIVRFQGNLAAAFVTALLGLLMGGAVLLWVVSGIRSRAYRLVGALGSLARADLTHEVPPKLLASGDELGRLAVSVAALQNDLKAQVKGIEAVLVDLSQIGSNLSSTVEESSASTEQMSAITASVARAAESQSQETDAAGQVVRDMVARIAHSNELTQGMATQFFLFSQSMEANRNRIQETAAEARTTEERAEELERTGEAGAQSLEALKTSIATVVQKSAQIEEIVRFILDIADRTNLLSMNAAIEAARAGSSGRGFSVVADEIRKLAVTSSQQAQTIRSLLDGITVTVNQTLTASETTAKAFATLKADISGVRDASRDIAEKMAAQEAEDEQLSSGLHQFAQFYAQLSEVLDRQAGESQKILGVLENLSDSGREISHSMAEQKIGMEQSIEASLVVRDTTMNLSQVIQVLEVQVGRFKTE